MIQPLTRPDAHRVDDQMAGNPYLVAFRHAPAKGLIVDGEGNVVDTTDLFLRHFGYGRHEVAGRPFALLVPPEMRVAADAALDPGEALLTRSSTLPLAIADRQGASVQVELEISRQSDRQLLVFVMDMAEAAEARSELERRNAELEQVNENLQNFASIASHDMQEPLRKIRYFSEMLRRALKEGHSDDVDYSLRVLGDASSRASRLVSDLLTFSRSTGDDLVRDSIDLADMLQDLVLDFRQGDLVGDADIRMDVSHCQISGDPTAISQLFRNLIGNALKYRSPDRRLSVRIETEVTQEPSPRLRVGVSDNGIGFEPQYAETIFQPFRRLHRRHFIPGNGIGLAICDTVARRHDWRLTAEGRVNEGATFTVEIPRFTLRKEAAQ
ncbi:ATP-binding protein [Breoghania sp.]|uniref:sensor histidine kinase n=1 Tax=Breoghania sp. TaxID=2065378 RepID=UPI002AAAFEF6|nr:ATP-binding protein [Breoghania sp.]